MDSNLLITYEGYTLETCCLWNKFIGAEFPIHDGKILFPIPIYNDSYGIPLREYKEAFTILPGPSDWPRTVQGRFVNGNGHSNSENST